MRLSKTEPNIAELIAKKEVHPSRHIDTIKNLRNLFIIVRLCT